MINEAKNIGVMVKSLSRNPFKRGEPEENTKLAILIVENGEDQKLYSITINIYCTINLNINS